MAERRPVWQRWWYILTAMFAFSLLAFGLQWNPSTLAPLPVSHHISHPFVPSPYMQTILNCLNETHHFVCPPVALPPGVVCGPPTACLLSNGPAT